MTYYITGLTNDRAKLIAVPTMTITDAACAELVKANLEARGLLVLVRTEEG